MVLGQRDFDMKKKKSEYDFEHLYHKPHFGPEDTDEVIIAHHNKRRSNKSFVNRSL